MIRKISEYPNTHQSDDEQTFHRSVMTPFANIIERGNPELAREIAGLKNRERKEFVSWLDGQPEDKGELNESALLISKAFHDSDQHMNVEESTHLYRQVRGILEYPIWDEIEILRDRVIITDALGEGDPEALRREILTLEGMLEDVTKYALEGMSMLSPGMTAHALHFMQYIRLRAARQVEGGGPHPPGEEPPRS